MVSVAGLPIRLLMFCLTRYFQVLPAWPFRKHSLEELSLNEDRKKRRRGILSITLPSEGE